ncbi:MAG: DUF3467 domain-containing protein [archaeon]
MTEKKLKFDIDNGQSFFADEAGVIHNPLRFILDFRSITPRVDVRNNEYQPIVLKHNVILMDPYMAKNIVEMLQENIKNYEKQFGKIEKPAALKKIERKAKKNPSEKKADAPGYFG